MRRTILSLLFFSVVMVCLLALPAMEGAMLREEVAISNETAECVECHEIYTPGIVADWRTSHHSKATPADALGEPEIKRPVSSEEIPQELLNMVVGCYECHSRNTDSHKDSFEHEGFQINVVVSPNDCATCHVEERDQYTGRKKAHALENLQKNPVYHALVETITSVKEFKDGEIGHLQSSYDTRGETCYACHGTEVTVKGMQTVSSEYGELEVPDLENWPNQGVGRINPDGSLGACTACHTRHSFSIEIARKPFTCQQCHLNPDVPAWEVYRESKHGNIFLSMQQNWNWESVPWKPGEDFRAPTCATCHNSLLVNAEGDVLVERNHDFGARLWVRIFGLIYTHPQPKRGETFLIKNEDGLPLSTTFTGVPAAEYLIDEAEQTRRRDEMTNVCTACHGHSWTAGHFEQLDTTITETDKMVQAATLMLVDAWNGGLADKTNPFNDAIEQKWIRQWLFYANSTRYGSAMGGQDYSAFKNGWWNLTSNLEEMRDLIKLKRQVLK